MLFGELTETVKELFDVASDFPVEFVFDSVYLA
jgi:hypothetical protein